MKKKICIICSAKLPQPPVLGGAVPVLIQHIIDTNEIKNDIDLTCFSIWNDKSIEMSGAFSNTHFEYAKISKFRSFLDSLITFFLNLIKKTNKIYSWGFLFRTLGFKNKVKKFLKHNDFDFVVFENSVPVLLCLKNRKLKKKYKGKIIYHTHCVPRDIAGSGRILSSCKSIFCVSRYIEENTKKRFAKYNLKTQVLYNCVDTNIFTIIDNSSKEEWRNRIGLQKTDFVVGFIGRLSRDKGVIQLIEAIKLIDDPEIKLVIAGSTFYDSNVKDEFSKYLSEISFSIKDRIIFTGYMQNELTPLFYSGCDVICLPPIWEEPGAVTNIEASACGCSIISTDSGGNKEYIGSKSIILQKTNLEQLPRLIADSVLLLKSNNELKQELSKRAYEWGSKQTKEEYYLRFLNLLKTL